MFFVGSETTNMCQFAVKGTLWVLALTTLCFFSLSKIVEFVSPNDLSAKVHKVPFVMK